SFDDAAYVEIVDEDGGLHVFYNGAIYEAAGAGNAPTAIAGIENEIQSLTTNHNAGTFELFFGGVATSAALDVNTASAADIQAALEGLVGIGAGNVSVTGTSLAAGDIAVEFTGTLENTDVDDLVIVDTALTGGNSVTTTTSQSGGGIVALTAGAVSYTDFSSSDSTFYTGSAETESLVDDYYYSPSNPLDPSPADGDGAFYSTFRVPLTLQHPGLNFKVEFHNLDLNNDGIGDSEIVGRAIGARYLDDSGDFRLDADFYFGEFDGQSGATSGGADGRIDSNNDGVIDDNDTGIVDNDGDGYADGVDDDEQVGDVRNVTSIEDDPAEAERDENRGQFSPEVELIDPRDEGFRINEGLDADMNSPFADDADVTDVPFGSDKNVTRLTDIPDTLPSDRPGDLYDTPGLGNVVPGSVVRWDLDFGISDFVAIANFHIGHSVTDVSNPEHADYDPSSSEYDPRLDPTSATFDWNYVTDRLGEGFSGDVMGDGLRVLTDQDNGDFTDAGVADFTPELIITRSGDDTTVKFDEANWSYVRNTDGIADGAQAGPSTTNTYNGQTYIQFDVMQQIADSAADLGQPSTGFAGAGGDATGVDSPLIGGLFFENDDVVVF
ncbi:MAG: hypothetical protein AAF226_13735, partial [Verrucomicrobiota bacterium]